MATEGPIVMTTGHLTAGADLSTTGKYRFVKLGSVEGTGILCNNDADRPYGVLQNNPKSGEEALVMNIGITKLEAGGALADGIEIGTAADGQAELKTRGTDLDEFIVGVVLETVANAAELTTAAINCIAPSTAAATS